MRVAIISISNRVYFLDYISCFYDINENQDEILRYLMNQKSAVFISNIFELFSGDDKKQDSSFGIMIIDDKSQVMDIEQDSYKMVNTDIKRMIKQQNIMVNQRLRQSRR